MAGVFKEAFQRLLKNKSGVLGLAIVLIFLAVAILADQISPYGATEMHPEDRLLPPNATYLLGTDEFGRDILSRLIHGARVSLKVAVLSVAAAGILGCSLGILSGYTGGSVDNLTMRVMDVIFAFPAILLALGIVAVLGAGSNNVIVAMTLVYLPIFARVARGPVLSTKEMEYVTAAHATGSSSTRIVTRHILPNITAPIIVQVSLALSWAILTEAALSFLGLGTQPPQPSWGNMLSESRTLMELAPWTAFSPGAAIMLAILGFNLLGDSLRDVLDPRLKQS
ncbi:MAG: ABC transporter permease [Anaerolineae bacterium]|nr:ABC transporter permease [Anaerolineae bacterium]